MRLKPAAALILTIFLLSGCVSTEKYLAKSKESEEHLNQLTKMEMAHRALQREKEEKDRQNARLSEDLRLYREDYNDLKVNAEKTLSECEAEQKSLQNHVSDLRDLNLLLKSDNKDLRAQKQQSETALSRAKSTYQNLLESMQSEIRQGKITITRLSQKLRVNMVDEILFDSGETAIKTEGIDVLERVGAVLSDVSDKIINIEGHTDNVPIGAGLEKRYPTNWELSSARAITVVRYLQDYARIDPTLLSATAYGPYQPIADNTTAEGRAKNRRIEIVLIPKEISPVVQ